ncbi:tRNA nucleotidyltransferase [Buchnera aphidicola str. Bp (Baizongia pistaciae)]|uniref:CCA-adding enzyme n=1 Tax=Buchnera aphidicola subsp. Baizongia pistaciae (strain Bp) TaxID=224915 RepID=CCA_BUCBP|nr:tRNA CCA-pyrophosphorylase [Buchnera aphidicola]Q89B06.1 RecName: Full=CCA-adding enzyme; AltName: Full=CCA tRNA nucleotidyltransferase; AltName: Full=tRNA CCA-pyrophosphorylase; AltName: Full=tRNA adenylyl-/cytidylyl- transferase; AltName: Full=tRNA nucleotidyltransferase; AltName: Full=tRNA-NT [Buchnera aphidicola str. Bp (Baizongia pistaciae)]AAO26796.1 tRNA nucleotidyltransferase [Buchnera aphidicola str. Bp (Baizongia pistaciae)]
MKVYLVGGAIRNKFLNLPVQDRDWVVVGATPEILLSLKFKQVGKGFPVFLHPYSKEEYSLARVDRKIGVGHTGFSFDYSNKVTLKEDLMRRDLTINAIAQDNNGNYIDPFKGIRDIKNRILRHVSPAFSEDPLRVLRIARFCALFHHLGFRIATETMKIMSIVVKNNELLNLTRDRVWKETEKAFNTDNPHVYFQVLKNCNALSVIFPEINLVYQRQYYCIDNMYHNFYDTFDIFMGLAELSKISRDIDIRFSYLFFCINRMLFIDTSSYILVINQKELVRYFKALCQRFCIPAYIKNVSICFSRFYKFLSVIHYQSSKDIIMFFYIIDAWRKPYMIRKLSVLNNFCVSRNAYFKNITCQQYPRNFLKYAFNVANKISIKPILKMGFSGLQIKYELIRLRINAIENWRQNITVYKKCCF